MAGHGGKYQQSQHLEVEAGGSVVQDHSWLCVEFQASLNDVKPVSKNKTNKIPKPNQAKPFYNFENVLSHPIMYPALEVWLVHKRKLKTEI